MNVLVTTLAGCGEEGFEDGKTKNAKFYGPGVISISINGKIYVSDCNNHRIRMISDGIVSTIAGCGKQGFQDGDAKNAMFNCPSGISLSQDGNIYVSDYYNNRIRMISNGTVSTIAGCGQKGFQDGDAKNAIFNGPEAICISDDGIIYVADSDNNRIRMISDGIVSTIAGCGKQGFQDGDAGNAMFNGPVGICISKDDIIYVSDFNNHSIRMISDGVVSTIAGCGKQGFQDGDAKSAMFYGPMGICVSDHGDIYVTDKGNNRIRMISKGMASTIAGSGKRGFQDGDAENAIFNGLSAIYMSNDGDLYVMDNHKVRMVSGLSDPYFELSSLIDSNLLSDMTLTINNHQYKLHTAVIQSLCPMLVTHVSIINDAKISHQSLTIMFEIIYSNNTKKIRKQKDKYSVSDLVQLVELAWMLESFRVNNNCLVTSCLEQFKTESKYFLEHERHKLTMNKSTTKLFSLIHDLIVLNDAHGFERTQLTQILNYLINQIKKYFGNQQKPTKTEAQENNDIPMSMHDMYVMFGLFTEPTVADQEKQSETVLQYLEQSKMTLATQPDYTIMTHDRSYSIRCHKLILCGKWSYFRRLIESGLSESRSGEMIMSEDWNATRLYDFVKYLYTHEVGFESMEDTVWLLKNAELYELIESSEKNGESKKNVKKDYELLIHECEKYASQEIDDENCCEMYKVSLEIGTEDRKKECYSYLVENVIELIKHDQIRNELSELGAEFIGKLIIAHYEAKSKT